MKNFFKFIGFIVLTVIIGFSIIGCPADDDSGNGDDTQPADAEVMSDKTALQYFTDEGITIGINVGNTLDAVDFWTDPNKPTAVETAWGNVPANQAYFNGLKTLGFKIVRIPVTWMGHIGAAPDYKIEAAYLQRVAEVVNMAHNAGLKAFINIHHDGNHSQGYSGWLDITKAASDPAITDKYVKVWTQIADYFKNYGDYLMFQGFNELHRGDWDHNGTQAEYNIINDWNQKFTNAVRGKGGNNAKRYLMYYGYLVSKEIAHSTLFKLPTDAAAGRQIVGFHYYEPGAFSLETKSIAYTGIEGSLASDFAAFKTKFVDNDIPVIIGENGPARYANYPGNTGYNAANVAAAHQNRLTFIDLLYSTARKNGIVPCYWENGSYSEADAAEGDFTLINRVNGQANSAASTEVIQRMMTTIADTTPLPPGGGEEGGGTTAVFTWTTNADPSSSIIKNGSNGAVAISGSVGAGDECYAQIIGTPDAATLAVIKSAAKFTLTVTGDGNSYRIMLVTPESENTGGHDHYGKDFPTTNGSSSTVAINISQLAQAGWGGTVSFNKNNVKSIQIQRVGSGAFNLTVSNIQFE